MLKYNSFQALAFCVGVQGLSDAVSGDYNLYALRL